MRSVIIGLGVLSLLLTSGCSMSAFNQRQFAKRTDAEICARYGVDPRSQVYLDCIVEQERRRDAATARQTGLISEGTDVVAGRRY